MMSIEMFHKDGETADQWEARINTLVPPPGTDVLGNSNFYNRRRDALADLQRERGPESLSMLPVRSPCRSTTLARILSALDEAKSQVRHLTDAERQQFILWVANGMPED
jgi:hypothetical protein